MAGEREGLPPRLRKEPLLFVVVVVVLRCIICVVCWCV